MPDLTLSCKNKPLNRSGECQPGLQGVKDWVYAEAAGVEGAPLSGAFYRELNFGLFAHDSGEDEKPEHVVADPRLAQWLGSVLWANVCLALSTPFQRTPPPLHP